jgi:hypothetical protein
MTDTAIADRLNSLIADEERRAAAIEAALRFEIAALAADATAAAQAVERDGVAALDTETLVVRLGDVTDARTKLVDCQWRLRRLVGVRDSK